MDKEFEEWLKAEFPLLKDEPNLRAAWNASKQYWLDKAAEATNTCPSITDAEGCPIFPEIADAIKGLKNEL